MWAAPRATSSTAPTSSSACTDRRRPRRRALRSAGLAPGVEAQALALGVDARGPRRPTERGRRLVVLDLEHGLARRQEGPVHGAFVVVGAFLVDREVERRLQ